MSYVIVFIFVPQIWERFCDLGKSRGGDERVCQGRFHLAFGALKDKMEEQGDRLP